MPMTMIDGREYNLEACEPYHDRDDVIRVRHEVVIEYDGRRGVVTKRYKSPREIYNDIHRKLDLKVCESCGHEWPPKKSEPRYSQTCRKCKTETCQELIDEYDSCCHFGEDEDIPISARDWHVSAIMVWCEPGSNEGHSVYVSVDLRSRFGNEHKVVNVYRIKSFMGLEYCHKLVWRIMGHFGLR